MTIVTASATLAFVRHEYELTIARAPGDVFAYLAHPANLPSWQRSVQRVTAPEDVAVGTRFTEERSRVGRVFRSTLEVVELEPDSVFTICVVEGPVKASIRHQLAAIPEGTRLTVAADADLEHLPRPLRALVSRSVESDLTRDFASLKRILEAASSPSRS